MATKLTKKYIPQVGIDYKDRVQAYRALGWEEAELRLESLLPLLMDNPLYTMGETEKAGQKTPTPEEQASKAVYKTETGQLYFPTDGVFKSLLTAAKTAPLIKRKSVSTLIQERVYLSPFQMLLEDADGNPVTEWEVAGHRIVVTAGAKMKYRALVPYWQATIRMQYHPVDLDIDTVLLPELNKAGLTIGIGAYRIKTARGNPGHYGMFHVKEVKYLSR